MKTLFKLALLPVFVLVELTKNAGKKKKKW